VTVQASSDTSLDVVPASSITDSDIHIVLDKHPSSDGIIKADDGSIHIVVDDKTSSRVVRTVVSFYMQLFVLNNECLLCMQVCMQKLR